MTIRKALVGLTAAGLLVSVPALASSASSASAEESNVKDDLAEMRELVEGLKQRVEAQEEQLGYQAERLEEAQKAVRATQDDEGGALSAISEFWQGIDVSMSTAGSYAYNFNNPDSGGAFPGAGTNQGASGLFYPFHGDHNSFQVDQVWLDIGKAPTEESRAGFQFTLLYGNTAAFLGQGGNGSVANASTDLDGDGIPDIILSGGGTTFPLSSSRRNGGDSASDYYVHQAYVSYLAPIGSQDVQFDFGKFATLIGAETANAAENWQITRGNIYNLFQPIDHVGLLTSTSFGDVSAAFAVVNSGTLGNSSPDINKEKTYIAQLGYDMDNVGTAVTVLYGADGDGTFGGTVAGDNEQKYGLVDLVATLEGQGFEAWLNADYLWVEGSAAQAWGVAVSGKVPLSDELWSAIRLEYARDKASNSTSATAASGLFGLPGGAGVRHSEVYGVTGTLGYELAENLTLKGEVRWDRVVDSGGPPDEFLTSTTGGDRDQVVGLAQVIYAF